MSIAPTASCTNAVVAICVVFVPEAAVGAVGVPVNAGLASLAYVVSILASLASLVAFVAEVALPFNAPLNVVSVVAAWNGDGLVHGIGDLSFLVDSDLRNSERFSI